MAHNWQKLKSIFLMCHYHKIDRGEAENLSINLQICLKNYNFCEYVIFGAILWICFFLITALLKFKKSFGLYVWQIWLWSSAAHHISFLHNQFSYDLDFPSQFCIFYITLFFFSLQNYRLKIFFYYGPWAKCTQLWALKAYKTIKQPKQVFTTLK